MTCLSQCVIGGALATVSLCGQSLHVPRSQTDRKRPGTFTLILESPPGKAPVALQWEIAIPPAIAVQKTDIAVGKAAESARKTLTCAASGKTPSVPGAARYTCILAGGQSPLANGPLVEVHYRAQADVAGAPIRVAVENIMGASSDLKRITIPDVVGIIEIR